MTAQGSIMLLGMHHTSFWTSSASCQCVKAGCAGSV
jgi:hypothetical protein